MRKVVVSDLKVGNVIIHPDNHEIYVISSVNIKKGSVYFTNGLYCDFSSVIGSYLIEEPKTYQIGGTHYNTENDPINFAKDNYPLEQLEGFFRINVDKYMARYHKKNGIEDIKKAKHYLELLLELKQNEQSN